MIISYLLSISLSSLDFSYYPSEDSLFLLSLPFVPFSLVYLSFVGILFLLIFSVIVDFFVLRSSYYSEDDSSEEESEPPSYSE